MADLDRLQAQLDALTVIVEALFAEDLTTADDPVAVAQAIITGHFDGFAQGGFGDTDATTPEGLRHLRASEEVVALLQRVGAKAAEVKRRQGPWGAG